MPIVAGLALLAMLGMGGGRVDLWAHLFGFFVGGVIGVLVAFAVPRPPGRGVQWALGGATLAVILYCWTLAFS
jgi:membrane associated rhomboid family serine protease